MHPMVRLSAHGFLVLLVASLFLSRDPVTVLFVGGIAALMIYGYLALSEILSSPDVLTPLSFHFLWYSFAYGVAAIYFGLAVWNSGSTSFDTIDYVSANNLARGYILCLLWSFILHCTLRKVAPRPSTPEAPKRIIHPLLGLVCFAAGIFVIVAPPGLAIVSGLPAFLCRLAPLAILMAIAFGSKNRKWFRTKLVTGAAILVAANMVAIFPYKSGVLHSLFPLMIAMWKHSRKLAITATCLIPLFYLTVVAPYVANSRNNLNLSPVERLGISNTDTQSETSKLMGRVFEPIEAGFIVGRTRFDNLLWGKTMANIQYTLIPRFLWPDKPEINSGHWFSTYLGVSADVDSDILTSTVMTQAGELYWNFSLPGVLLGTIVIGFLYGGMWRLAEKYGKGTFLGSMIYLVALVSTNYGDASGAITLSIGIYALLIPLLLWPRFKRALVWFFFPPIDIRTTRSSSPPSR